MATEPEKGTNNAPNTGSNKVEVDPAALKRQVRIYKEWGDHILTNSAGLTDLKIAPGNFPAAHRYKNTVEKRINNLWSNCTNIGSALITISKNLTVIADSYINVNDRNVDEAKRAGTLANEVSMNAPGAGGAVTVPPGSQPPPQAPTPAPVPDGGGPAK